MPPLERGLRFGMSSCACPVRASRGATLAFWQRSAELPLGLLEAAEGFEALPDRLLHIGLCARRDRPQPPDMHRQSKPDGKSRRTPPVSTSGVAQLDHVEHAEEQREADRAQGVDHAEHEPVIALV